MRVCVRVNSGHYDDTRSSRNQVARIRVLHGSILLLKELFANFWRCQCAIDSEIEMDSGAVPPLPIGGRGSPLPSIGYVNKSLQTTLEYCAVQSA